jgi:hypothetical protein
MLGALAGFLVKRNTEILTFKSAPDDRTKVHWRASSSSHCATQSHGLIY